MLCAVKDVERRVSFIHFIRDRFGTFQYSVATIQHSDASERLSTAISFLRLGRGGLQPKESSTMEPTIAHMLLPRQSSDAGGTDTSSGFDSSSSGAPSGITFDSDGNCSGDQFLCLISSPFESQVS